MVKLQGQRTLEGEPWGGAAGQELQARMGGNSQHPAAHSKSGD